MFSRRITLGVVCTATAMLMLDIAVVNTALKHIAMDLHAGLAGVQWVVDAYTLALAATVLTIGSLSDRFGRRAMLLAGLGVFTAASMACGAAGTITQLDLFRAVQGVGAAAMFATTLAILSDAFVAPAERAKAFGAYGATIGGAFAIGPLVGGVITSTLGWNAIFFLNVPIGITCIALTVVGVRESRDPRPRRVDLPGQLLLTGGLFLLVFAMLRGNTSGWSSAQIVASLAGAAVLLLTFAAVEARRPDAMLPLGLFKNRSFTAAQVAAFGVSASFFAVFFYMSLYLQVILGLSPIKTGLVILPTSVVVFVVSGVSASLAERFSPKVLLGVGLNLVALGLGLSTIAGVHSSWVATLPGALLAGIGTGILNPTISALALGSLDGSQSGLAAGANDTFRNVGIAVGIAALGALVPSHAAVGSGSPAAFVSGYHHALIVGSIVAGLASGGVAVLLRRQRTPVEAERPAEVVPIGAALAEASA
jgi:EmrB/QacA subfamily drug resistance transporter